MARNHVIQVRVGATDANLVAAAEESSTGVSSCTGLSVLETGARLRPELQRAPPRC